MRYSGRREIEAQQQMEIKGQTDRKQEIQNAYKQNGHKHGGERVRAAQKRNKSKIINGSQIPYKIG